MTILTQNSFCIQQSPVILAANDQQKKKYLGRMTEELMFAVRECPRTDFSGPLVSRGL